MVQVVLLLKDHVWTELLWKPCDVASVSKLVDVSWHEYSWQVVVLDRYGWCINLTVDLVVGTWAVVVECQVASYHGLSVPGPCTIALAGRHRAQHWFKPGDVKDCRINKHVHNFNAKIASYGTESVDCSRAFSVVREPVVNLFLVDKHFNYGVDMYSAFFDYTRDKLSLQNWRQSDEYVHPLFKVGGVERGTKEHLGCTLRVSYIW